MSKLVLTIILGSMLIAGCERRKSSAIGGNDQIIIIADSSNWELGKEILKKVFERTYFTPQPETDFYIQKVPISLFETYKKYKNVIMIGTLDSDQPVSNAVKAMLSEDATRAVETGQYFVFTRNDEWTLNQRLMILTAPAMADLNLALQDNADMVYDVFNQHKNELVYDFIYTTSSPLENKELQNELFKKYGWYMRIHPDFKLLEDKEDSNYVRFHSRSYSKALQRWISLYWVSVNDSSEAAETLSKSWMISTRSKIGSWFFEPVVNDSGYDNVRLTIFNHYNALEYTGIWKTADIKNAFGGPFKSTAFYDDSAKKIFFIDEAVFFPEDNQKLKYMRELDVIIHTFSLSNPNLR
ncbi:DUF4837 family protein [bacterium]|nr:DUF4837 family protein [bacterium]